MGEADSYYNPGQQVAAPPPQYSSYHEQPGAYNGYRPPPPPQQQQQYGPPPNEHGELDEKQSFDQTFKIERPKWNDLWAGILVSLLQLPSTIPTARSWIANNARWYVVPPFLCGLRCCLRHSAPWICLDAKHPGQWDL